MAFSGESQTDRCSRLAAQHYSASHGVDLEDLDPVDSHAFSCRSVDADDGRLCFHVNFRADAGPHGTRLFFAEILGSSRPESVQHCVMLGGPSTRCRNNCKFCSEIWPPTSSGTFDFGRH
ncbi:uncharacterized protein LOC125518714 [Triticum urartu]|uniref:uncharacterized protein LOC125518714 n=1 Tax=Triticum urartu TaxID=4572 RepID=UPI0020443761|nr:uncharacterized protein LOC125518714 [Triticum urartu]